MAIIKVDGVDEEYISVAHSVDGSKRDFYVTEFPSEENNNVYKGFYIVDDVGKYTTIDQEGWEEYKYTIEPDTLTNSGIDAEIVQSQQVAYALTDNTYVNIDKVSECGKNYALRANELDRLMDNLQSAFDRTLDTGWIDDNSARLKIMFKDFIEESKKINSDIRDYGKIITEAALKYSMEQKNTMVKLEGEKYGK